MGLLDKAKAAAEKVAAEAKKGATQVQEKVEQTQTRKKADDLAKRLGYLIVRERTGGEPAGQEAEQLVGEIVGLEGQIAESGQEPAAPASAGSSGAPAAPPTSASQPAAGDFKLD